MASADESMRIFAFASALVLVACGGVTSSPPDMQPQPAPGVACADPDATAPADDGCNACTCGSDGTWACTELLCSTPECTPGDTKVAEDGCSDCTCSDDGTWVCTETTCLPVPCTPGDVVEDVIDCNDCFCADDGTWGCTLIGCGDPSGGSECPGPTLPASGAACPTISAHARSEETGLCCQFLSLCEVPTGWTAYGTEEECLMGGTPEPCTVGRTVGALDGCNSCTCSDGGTWTCTQADCVGP